MNASDKCAAQSLSAVQHYLPGNLHVTHSSSPPIRGDSEIVIGTTERAVRTRVWHEDRRRSLERAAARHQE